MNTNKMNRKESEIPCLDDTAMQINIKVDGNLVFTDGKGNPLKPIPISPESLPSGLNGLKSRARQGANKVMICVPTLTGIRCFKIP